MSASAVAPSRDAAPDAPSSDRPLFDANPEPADALERYPELGRTAVERSATGARAAALPMDPIRRRRLAPTIDVTAERRADAMSSRTAIDARRIDRKSRAWLDALRSSGLRREEAIGRLHALLLREARFEVGRRTAHLAHPSGRDLDDLAMQAADDAVVAILAKLDQFRGDSLFTTWARRFAQLEAPAKIRRRLGRARELPSEDGFEHDPMWAVDHASPHDRSVANESARTLARLIADELTPHQRKVLVALVIDGVSIEHLARRLDTTPGALYKTLHDARRKLRKELATSGLVQSDDD
jgi:RNA polymerase sigma-70 factor, ECF subfamily